LLKNKLCVHATVAIRAWDNYLLHQIQSVHARFRTVLICKRFSHAKTQMRSSKTPQPSFAHATNRAMTSAFTKTSLFARLVSAVLRSLFLIFPSWTSFSMWRFRCKTRALVFFCYIRSTKLQSRVVRKPYNVNLGFKLTEELIFLV